MRICGNCGFFTEKDDVYTCPDCQGSTHIASDEELKQIKKRKDEIGKRSDRFCLVDMKSTDSNMRPSKIAYILAVIYGVIALAIDVAFPMIVINSTPEAGTDTLIFLFVILLVLSGLPLVLLLFPNFTAWFVYSFTRWQRVLGTKDPDSYAVSDYQYRFVIPSMAAFLLSSGKKGKRYALPSSEIMIHQPLGGAQGQASDIKIQAEHILEIKKKLNAVLAENTGKPVEQIERDTDRDNYLSAEAALEYGLIDKIFYNR